MSNGRHGLRLRPEQQSPSSLDEIIAKELAAKIIVSPLKIVAIDFDNTLIDEDSGSWMSHRNTYIRNQFYWLIPHILHKKWICIASFNQNTPHPSNENLGIVTQTVVRRLLKLTDRNLNKQTIHYRLATEYKIIIEAYPGTVLSSIVYSYVIDYSKLLGRQYGKFEHLESAIVKIKHYSTTPVSIEPFHVALFDDHPRNITVAKQIFPAALISIQEFSKKCNTMEPIMALIEHVVKRSTQEKDKWLLKKRKHARGNDRIDKM
ncbi:unnamed protein product [Didymodactylos carnosus]|uniref:Uncharacterized protein n=1 Tax=Didymodactylos carnosus TaxID=1234261 RepID=A0A813VLV5_9BILA|nr:unnamed protein product [Didymodactylos carnosus]CAF3632781.1 unnamed protein product [Didymodactylos carnosus]